MISSDQAIELCGENRKLQSGRGSLYLGKQIQIEPEPQFVTEDTEIQGPSPLKRHEVGKYLDPRQMGQNSGQGACI